MNDDFHAKLEQLVDHYLSLGCPCRFSRFRSVVARDTSRGCGGAFTSEEQRLLIAIFEAKVASKPNSTCFQTSLALPISTWPGSPGARWCLQSR